MLAAAEAMMARLEAKGLQVFLDDRDERPGVQFATMDLIGLPHRLVISEKTLAQSLWEYRGRRDSENRLLSEAEVLSILQGEPR